MKTVLRLFSGLSWWILLLGTLAGCGGSGGGSAEDASALVPGGDPVLLVSVEVTPTQPSMALGTTKDFTATGVYSDNTRQDLTTAVTWSSSSTSTATVSNADGSKGMATSLASGITTITATLGDVSGSTTLTVTTSTLSSIEVTPTNTSIGIDRRLQFAAMGVFTDNSVQDLTTQVAWSSQNPAVAAIDAATGLATSAGVGSTTITATLQGKSGSTGLAVTPATLVSIDVTPALPSSALGTSQPFAATGIYSDGTTADLTTEVAWNSSDPAVVTVSNAPGSKGLATSSAVGLGTVTATSGAVSGSTILTVTNATLVSIGVTPASPIIAVGRNQQFTATGVFTDNSVQDLTTQVTWSSLDPAVARIHAATGLATSVGGGSTTVTATLSGKTGSTGLTVTLATLVSIDVTPALPSIALGTSQPLAATGTYSDDTTADLTTAVAWSSSSPEIATAGNAPGSKGLATSVAAGLTTITATLGSVTGSTDLTVNPATLVSIDVAPTDPSVSMGLPQQFSASGNFTDGSVQDLTTLVTWSSSDTGVAAVSNASSSKGLATPVALGNTTITARLGGVSENTTLTVTPATLVSIAITHTNPPANQSIALGTALQFTATGTYTDGTTQDLSPFVTWSSSAGSVAVISNAEARGLATSVGAGSTTITAALGGTISPPATLTVTSATLTSIAVTPGNATIFLGAAEQFTALATFSDGSVQDLTTQVTWKASNRTITAISNVSGSNGLATPIRAGSTNISATFAYAKVTGTTGLIVSSATLTGIVITPAEPSVAVGKTLQFKATGTYAGGLTQELTYSKNLAWASSDKTVSTITNVPKKNKGRAKGVKTGSVTIKASMRSGISGNTTLTVTP